MDRMMVKEVRSRRTSAGSTRNTHSLASASGRPRFPINNVWMAASAMEHGLRVATTDAHYSLAPQILVDLFDLQTDRS
ncbi:MAG: hypothetical protein QN175_10015 [Armatimonadota bacterium]|nr:hypothetical protein [Armatimonadota bacterium]